MIYLGSPNTGSNPPLTLIALSNALVSEGWLAPSSNRTSPSLDTNTTGRFDISALITNSSTLRIYNSNNSLNEEINVGNGTSTSFHSLALTYNHYGFISPNAISLLFTNAPTPVFIYLGRLINPDITNENKYVLWGSSGDSEVFSFNSAYNTFTDIGNPSLPSTIDTLDFTAYNIVCEEDTEPTGTPLFTDLVLSKDNQFRGSLENLLYIKNGSSLSYLRLYNPRDIDNNSLGIYIAAVKFPNFNSNSWILLKISN